MFKGIFAGLIELIYPRRCLSCRRSIKTRDAVDDLVCGECWNAIRKNQPPFCLGCGRHLETELSPYCRSCHGRHFHYEQAYAACSYEGALKELIHAFKYGGREYLGDTLGRLLADFVKTYPFLIGGTQTLIPVPLHNARLREREFNQSLLLCEYLAKKTGKDLETKALIRTKKTRSQAELKEDERRLNVRGCFLVVNAEKIAGKHILLVDDVLTTGSTLSEAALALKSAGAAAVTVFTLAN